MNPKHYRKKPVVIQALKFVYSREGIAAMHKFLGEHLGNVVKHRHQHAIAEAEIKTLEDGMSGQVVHIATEGDYIIKGVQGEFYACKPDIFEETYQGVEVGI